MTIRNDNNMVDDVYVAVNLFEVICLHVRPYFVLLIRVWTKFFTDA